MISMQKLWSSIASMYVYANNYSWIVSIFLQRLNFILINQLISIYINNYDDSYYMKSLIITGPSGVGKGTLIKFLI